MPMRAPVEIAFMRSPPLPMTMAFWLSRSSQITAAMRSSAPSSSNFSISTVAA